MADTKISALSALTGSSITATDAIPVVDDMSGTPGTYRIQVNDVRGSWEHVATATGSDVASIEITDIPTGFDLHRITIPWVSVATDGVTLGIRVSSDNGSTYENSSYDSYGGGSSSAPRLYTSSTEASSNSFHLNHSSYDVGNDTDEGANYTIDVINLTNALYTRYRALGMVIFTDATNRIAAGRGEHQSATVMDAIQLLSSSGNISGTMVLEGYRYS